MFDQGKALFVVEDDLDFAVNGNLRGKKELHHRVCMSITSYFVQGGSENHGYLKSENC